MVERENKNDRKGEASVINIIVCLWYPSDGSYFLVYRKFPITVIFESINSDCSLLGKKYWKLNMSCTAYYCVL